MAEQTRRKKKKANVVVWVILGLLILALGGFGASGFGSSLSTVASVGDREITVQEYGDALRAEQVRVEEQFGQQLTMAQMQVLGLDRAVMERLLAAAALEVEADRMGLSIGDAEVARRIRDNPAFAGVAGGFDREGYAFALNRAGLTETGFEERVRSDIARDILQAAIVGGTQVPEAFVDTLVAYVGETRDVTLTPVTPADLPGGALAPTEADVQAFYDASPDLFEAPELRALTYAWVTPDMIVGDLGVDETQLRQIYDERIDDYRQPARVLAERLAFADLAAAEAALASITAGETAFDALVAARGLTLEDVDQGEIARTDVGAGVADALFALEEPGIVGPVETPLGPALYRVNAILNPTEIPFEDVRDTLASEVGLAAARREIEGQREAMEDMLAGGATLEELAADTDMVLGSIRWDADGETQGSDIAAYDGFRAAARTAAPGDFPEIGTLSDGGLFALRLDEIVPPTVPPLAQVRGEVEAAWRVTTLTRQLADRAAEIASDPDAVPAGTPETISALARDATLEGTPPALVAGIFEAADGSTIGLPGDDARAYVVRIDAVTTPGPDDATDLRAAIGRQVANGIASDIFEGYGRAVQTGAGFTVDQSVVQQVQMQLGGSAGG